MPFLKRGKRFFRVLVFPSFRFLSISKTKTWKVVPCFRFPSIRNTKTRKFPRSRASRAFRVLDPPLYSMYKIFYLVNNRRTVANLLVLTLNIYPTLEIEMIAHV